MHLDLISQRSLLFLSSKQFTTTAYAASGLALAGFPSQVSDRMDIWGPVDRGNLPGNPSKTGVSFGLDCLVPFTRLLTQGLPERLCREGGGFRENAAPRYDEDHPD